MLFIFQLKRFRRILLEISGFHERSIPLDGFGERGLRVDERFRLVLYREEWVKLKTSKRVFDDWTSWVQTYLDVDG